MISEPNFWNFVTNLFLFSSHKHSSGAWGSFQPLKNSKNEIRGRKIQFMKKIAWIWTKYLKIIDFSYNLKKTIFLVWKVIFSICKNLKSSVFCGENFRMTTKEIFHILVGSKKPKLSKISNFKHKFPSRNPFEDWHHWNRLEKTLLLTYGTSTGQKIFTIVVLGWCVCCISNPNHLYLCMEF